MTRRCKPGQRARIIVGRVDKGKIVLVVRAYRPGEKISDAEWPKAIYPWVVTSLGAPIHWSRIGNPAITGLSSTIVLCDTEIEPLEDDDDGLARDTDVSTPKDLPKARVNPVPKGVAT
ncbi:hypothetical protein [Ottowia thiooxydans]|uniref:hypothetical protein n=1 Tax=Ottowia thiooxydans TaxID=219182 RepID=UPI00048CCBCF|nr:hypothetical protein [Ottowia thiooxydans]